MHYTIILILGSTPHNFIIKVCGKFGEGLSNASIKAHDDGYRQCKAGLTI